ncbi:MAG: hypothetical protein ACOX2R_03260 [Anaerolineae bacterium]|jgi:predicted transcriptional regulator
MASGEVTYVRLSDEERQFIDAVAKSTMRSRNAVMRMLVQRAMAMSPDELETLFGAGVRQGEGGDAMSTA